MTRAGNVVVEFEDGIATCTLLPEGYGENETWVIVRPFTTADEDSDNGSTLGEEEGAPLLAPTSATKAPKRRRKVTVDCDETDDQPP